MNKDNVFVYEIANDRSNQITVVAQDDGYLSIAVAEEKAVDSYNHDFECTIYLDNERALLLRDFLNRHYAKAD